MIGRIVGTDTTRYMYDVLGNLTAVVIPTTGWRSGTWSLGRGTVWGRR